MHDLDNFRNKTNQQFQKTVGYLWEKGEGSDWE